MTVKRVPAVCCACGVELGNFVVDPDEDMGLSLPNLWCESCKQGSLRERGIEPNILDESSQTDRKVDDASSESEGLE